MSKKLFYFIFLTSSILYGQEINLKLIDSLSKETIPFASVTTNFDENAITNEEGAFKLTKYTSFTAQDSLFISCMGFEPYREAIDQLPDSLLLLAQKSIELNDVILTQNNLSAEEVVKRARENVENKYDLSFTQKTFFLRESFDQKWVQRDLEVKKSTIKELNQIFWDSILRSIPINDTWHTETLGKLHGDWSKEEQKLVLLRGVDLADTINAKGYEQIENKITDVLDKNVKEKSYFKFRSGIFSTKIDRSEIIERALDSTAIDTTELADQTDEKKRFHKERKKRLTGVFDALVKRNRLDIEVLKKSSLYQYELLNFTFMDNKPVYQIRFIPNNKKAKYKGTLYVEADTYTLIQLDYENVKSIRDFSLLGLSFNAYGRKVKLRFNSFNGLRYQLQYAFFETKFRTGIDRPIKVVEKNKFVRGRRKQNELKGEVHFKLDQKSTTHLVIFDSQSITEEKFKQLKENKRFSPEKRDTYDPAFWAGYNIIEPNEAIRSFTVEEEVQR